MLVGVLVAAPVLGWRVGVKQHHRIAMAAVDQRNMAATMCPVDFAGPQRIVAMDRRLAAHGRGCWRLTGDHPAVDDFVRRRLEYSATRCRSAAGPTAAAAERRARYDSMALACPFRAGR